jgi:hypothetical protein
VIDGHDQDDQPDRPGESDTSGDVSSSPADGPTDDGELGDGDLADNRMADGDIADGELGDGDRADNGMADGEPDANPREQDDPPHTGDPEVDAALATAAGLRDAEPAEQLETYVGTHRSLQDRLADSGGWTGGPDRR